MKVTRREIVALVIASGTSVAQDTPDDQIKRNADALDKFEPAIETEPAFAFKA
jgi:hypothetical protein